VRAWITGTLGLLNAAFISVLPIMRRHGGGYIVNVGSIGGLIAIPYQPFYSASKFALEGMTAPWASASSSSSPAPPRPRLLRIAGWRKPLRSLPFPRRGAKRKADDEQHGLGPDGAARLKPQARWSGTRVSCTSEGSGQRGAW
jgi:hypothetical protein